MPEEKTILQCADQGCPWCGFVSGYLGLQPRSTIIFPSQLLAATRLASMGGNECQQRGAVELAYARRMQLAIPRHRRAPKRAEGPPIMKVTRLELIFLLTESLARAPLYSFQWRYLRVQQSAIIRGGILL